MNAAMLEAIASAKKGGTFNTFNTFDAKKASDIAHGKRKRKEEESDEESEEDSEGEGAEKVEPIDWANAPTELKEPSHPSFTHPEAYVGHVIRYLIGLWRVKLKGGELSVETGAASQELQLAQTLGSKDSLKQTESALAPLVRLSENAKESAKALEGGKKKNKEQVQTDNTSGKLHSGGALRQESDEMSVIQRLLEMSALTHERNYFAANNHYVQMTVGNKKWHQAVMFGEAKSNKGFHMRKVQRSALNEYDSDETKQTYVRAFRRLLQLSQKFRPNDDPSKHM